MNSITLGTWNLSTEEIGYYVGKSDARTDGSSFKVYIPKILPMIKRGTAQIHTEPLSVSGIINDIGCKLETNSSVKTRNYLEVTASDNINFKRPVFKNGAKVKIAFVSGNIDNGKLMNTIDSSTFDKKVTSI